MQTLQDLKERTKWAIDCILERHHLKSTEISKMLGVKPDTIRKYRSKLATPRVIFLQKFCATFGIDFHWLSKGIGKPFPTEDDTCRHDEKPEDCLTTSPPGELYSQDIPVESEMSFQKLAVLMGIKIDNEWIVKIASIIGVPPWKISLSIYRQRIDGELILAVEDCGYERHKWIVTRASKKSEPEADFGELNVSQLCKMAEELLRSNTIHATSLAMNIISLKAVYDNNASAQVSGIRAISLP